MIKLWSIVLSRTSNYNILTALCQKGLFEIIQSRLSLFVVVIIKHSLANNNTFEISKN